MLWDGDQINLLVGLLRNSLQRNGYPVMSITEATNIVEDVVHNFSVHIVFKKHKKQVSWGVSSQS